MPKSKPVTIRGVTYPSQKAAAEALGVDRSAVTLAKRHGRLKYVGTGTGSTRKISCRIGEYDFPSLVAAARALGVHEMYISGYLSVLRALEKYDPQD